MTRKSFIVSAVLDPVGPDEARALTDKADVLFGGGDRQLADENELVPSSVDGGASLCGSGGAAP